MRSAETELQNTRELRAMASEIVAPKPGSRRQSEKKTILKHFLKNIFRRKITSAKMEKICWQITVAAFMQPLQYDLRSPAAKDNSITHAATAWSNLDAAITMRSAETELQNTIELRATASEIVAPKPDLDARAKKKTILKHFLKGFLEGKSLAPKTHFVRDFLQNSIGNSSTSTTCNPIYIAGTILQLQITMEFCRPRMHEKHLKPHLQLRNRSDHGPRMIRPWSDHTHETVSQPSHRRGRSSRFGDGLCMENIGFRASAISQKRISCETSSKTPSATPPPAPLAIPFTWRERSYSCKSQWNSVDRACTKNTWNPIYNAEPIRPWSENDPTMIRPWSDHTRDRLATVAPQR